MRAEETFDGGADSDPAFAQMLAVDALLDSALADSFPASDPPALCSPHSRPKDGAKSNTAQVQSAGAVE